ncbi:hypothetical protein SLS53_006822 [Cytospora paraplurivora]|uniref:NACHT domain-containing protein n=1 Tax=Cytospora paraplurivora TaxID=2898453 RepID=A0AAN9YDJ9_9PEZI
MCVRWLTDMDPLAIITFAGNILHLLSCGKDMVELAREIHRSPAGATKSNEDTASFVKRSQALSQAVRVDRPISQLTDNEKHLCSAAVDCESICLELEKELLKLSRGDGKKSVFNSGYLAVRSCFAKDNVKELNERLARCEGHMNAHLLCLLQSDFKDSFAQFLATSEDSRTHTAAVREGIDALRQGLKVSSFDEAALRQLKELLEISESDALRRRQRQILRALQFDEMKARYAGVSGTYKKTFDWIFSEQSPGCKPLCVTYSDHQKGMEDGDHYNRRLRLEAMGQFMRWLEADPKSHQDAIFHISGKPGAGKSTLMKYLSQHENTRMHLQRWSKDKEVVIGAFFFWKPGSDSQKSQHGLIRALLHSILSEAPDLIPTAFPSHWLETQHFKDDLVVVEQHEIEGAFNTIIRDPQTYTRHRFVFFLDGLDEFEDKLHHSRKQHLASLILGWVRDTKGLIKIIASSRHYVEFENAFERGPGIRLQDLTRSDMETVVAGRLAEIQEIAGHTSLDSLTLWRIRVCILEKAKGVFLWVTLVLRTVETGILQGDSWRVLEQKIDSLPTELEDLLQRMFDEIDPSDRKKALQTFHTALNMDNGGKYMGLRFHLWLYTFWDEVVLDPNFVSKRPISTATQEEVGIGLTKCKRQIYGVCRGLLDIVWSVPHPRIEITHRSMVEFLHKSNNMKQILEATKDFDYEDIIRQCFLGYVKMVVIPEHICEMVRSIINIYANFHRQGDTCRFLDFLDQLLGCIEGREKHQFAFFEVNEASGEEEATAISPAVEIAKTCLTFNIFPEYVSRNKRSFSKIINGLAKFGPGM